MQITRKKRDAIRQSYIGGCKNISLLAKRIGLSENIISRYVRQFELIEKEQPERLKDFNFFIGKEGIVSDSIRYQGLMQVLPELVAAEKGPALVARLLYRKYCARFPGREVYSEPHFHYHFKRWFEQHEKEISAKRLTEKFTADELVTLRKWRKSNDRRLWQVAVTLMTVYTYQSFSKVAEKIESSADTMLHWLRLYEKHGLEAVSRPGSKQPISKERQTAIEKRIDELVHLVRQSPKTYGIDRNSWTLMDLAYTYGELSGRTFHHSTIRTYLWKRGVKYKRSREMIVSTDPQYREKYEHIQRILSGLSENEKFFSIDEYGPKAVRPKGGAVLTEKGKRAVFQKVDRSKGWFICTCALELSTNQLTWFYSRKKDTEEIIKLIEVLTLEYQEQKRLYLSWDAAGWHDSKQLRDYLLEVNEREYREKLKTPEIILVPLPTKAPHLNVIESVFSGMARSVIHHSDYESVEECTAAIDKYFNKRNLHFSKNPKRAGQKIWGKEKVKPVFHKANICRRLG